MEHRGPTSATIPIDLVFSHHPEVQKKKKEMYELQYEAIAIRVQKFPVQVLYCPAIPAGVIWSSFLR
jgi:hypothetical protein